MDDALRAARIVELSGEVINEAGVIEAVKPSIGHLKADHHMRRNFLKGILGDAMNPTLAAAGFNIRWLMEWLVIS